MKPKPQKHNALRVDYGFLHSRHIICILKLFIEGFNSFGNLNDFPTGNSTERKAVGALPGKRAEVSIRMNNLDVRQCL